VSNLSFASSEMKGFTSDDGIRLFLFRLAWLDEAGFLVAFFGLGWFLGAIVGWIKNGREDAG